jgi:hypothetical protein
MTVEERIAEYKRKIAVCDVEEREAENPRMVSAVLIYGGAVVAIGSFFVNQYIGLTLGIIGVISGCLWRSDLNTKSLWRFRLRDAHRAALKSLTGDPPTMTPDG